MNKLMWIWLSVLFVLCVVIIILLVSYVLPNVFVKTDIPIFTITFLTMLALFIYAYDTHIMVKRQYEKDLTPSIGFELFSQKISGKPNHDYYIGYDISLELVSYSVKETISKVYLDLFIDDIKVQMNSDAYEGAPVWIIPPYGKRSGHFLIDDIIVKSVNPELFLHAASWNPPEQILITLYYISEIKNGYSHTFSEFSYNLDLYSGKLILL